MIEGVMKKLLPIFVLLITALPLWGQTTSEAHSNFYKLRNNEGLIGGGFGMSWIDDQPYYSFRFFPEIAFSKVGIGLDLKLEYGTDGKIRSENFNDFSDYLAIIRYIRYGYKGDPLYFRVGALDYATLGHGSIMYMYNNSPSFDNRKVGVEFDIDFTTFGVQTVYGTFGEEGVIGARGYIRPLYMAEKQNIPILGNLEVGATIATDFNDKAGIEAGRYIADEELFRATEDAGAMTIVGLDLGLPVLRTALIDLDLYFDYVNIVDFGNGTSAGFISKINGIGLADVWVKFERRFNSAEYIPSYFNSLYEIERFRLHKDAGTFESKAQRLRNTPEDKGWYGEIVVKLLNTFDVIGSYQRLDKDPESGILHLETEIMPQEMPYVFRAGYDKVRIKSEKDIFTLDDRSFLFAEFGYKVNKYLLASMVYSLTYTPLRDGNDDVIGYEPQRRFEPRLSFIYPFDAGN